MKSSPIERGESSGEGDRDNMGGVLLRCSKVSVGGWNREISIRTDAPPPFSRLA